MKTPAFTHDTYLNPFTWRYGSSEMRHIWSEVYKRRLWRRIWVALAEVQAEIGVITQEQVEDLRAHMEDIDLQRAAEIEADIHHDLMAEVRTYAEQCPVGGGIIHLGATSMDIEDNADALRLREALDIILIRLREVLHLLADLIEREAEHVCMGFTHLQPAEPTTVGYRLAGYGQDLLADWESLSRLREHIRGKGFKGAVGTSASYAELLRGTGITPQEFEKRVMARLSLDAYPVTHQTYPRRQDWEVVSALASMGMTLYRLAFDLRVLQSPPFGEWQEPFGRTQVGSSAMPFKRNPIHAENMNSLARFLAALPRVMWDNAAHSLLERTLDDSANRRLVLPEAFLAADELLRRCARVLKGLRLNETAIARNVYIYGTFAATERVLMEAVRNGANRQTIHEIIREYSMQAWRDVQEGKDNPLVEMLCRDERLTRWLSPARIRRLMDVREYVGDAPQRARGLAAEIRRSIHID